MSIFDTFLTKSLGIEHPIICGGMHQVTNYKLIAAVANAGCLGFITALSSPTAEDLRVEIKNVKN